MLGVEMGWIRTNDGYPIDLQSTALDRSATTSYKKKKPMNGTFTRTSGAFQPLPPAYTIYKTKVFAHHYYTLLN